MASGKYQHLLKPLKIAEMPGGSSMFRNTGNSDSLRWLNGRDHLEGETLPVFQTAAIGVLALVGARRKELGQ